MAEWIGLAGVVAGAVIAFGGQYLLRRAERQDRNDALLLEQFAIIIALSEDYRNRVWEERNQVANSVVNAWDLGTYRLAEARLRVLSRDSAVVAALKVLHEAGTQLGKAWRLGSSDEAAVEQGLGGSSQGHRAVRSGQFSRGTAPNRLRPPAPVS